MNIHAQTLFLMGTLSIGLGACGETSVYKKSLLSSDGLKGGATVVLTQGNACQVLDVGGAIWMRRFAANGNLDYEVKLGAGGSIELLKIGNLSFLAKPYAGEVTDRVIHSVFFHRFVSMPKDISGEIWNADYRFNVNQAGNRLGSDKNPSGLSSVLGVAVDTQACKVDIEVSATGQFNEQLDPFFKFERHFLITFQIRDQGELMVRKTETLGSRWLDTRYTGVGADNEIWLEEWVPYAQAKAKFLVSSMADDGQPASYVNGKPATEFPNESSSGYYVAASTLKAAKAGIAVAYGTQVPRVDGAVNTSWRSLMLAYSGGTVVMADPQIRYDGTQGALAAGTVIDRTYFILPQRNSRSIWTPEFAAHLKSLVAETSAAQIMSPDYAIRNGASSSLASVIGPERAPAAVDTLESHTRYLARRIVK